MRYGKGSMYLAIDLDGDAVEGGTVWDDLCGARWVRRSGIDGAIYVRKAYVPRRRGMGSRTVAGEEWGRTRQQTWCKMARL